jgi:hypothetical protein
MVLARRDGSALVVDAPLAADFQQVLTQINHA